MALDEALALLDAAPDGAGALLAVRVRITRAWTTMELEGLDPALGLLRSARGEAVAAGDRALLALTHIQESNILARVGDWQGALAALGQVGADETLLAPAQRCALHINRGLAHLTLGQTGPAREALETALGLATEHGFAEQEFKARHNLGCLAFAEDDLPRALLLMRAADALDAEVSRDRARLDYAEVLLAAGLVDQAREALEDALATAHADGHRLEVGDIALRLARCDILVEDLAGAREHLRSATAAYRTRQAAELVAGAEIVRAAVDIGEGRDLPGVVVGLGSRPARDPEGDGRPRTSSEREAVRLEAEARLLLGDLTGARRRLDAADGSRTDSLAGQLHELLVRARMDHLAGRPAESARWVEEGNRLLAAHQFRSSSLDVRAALALHARRLAAFDVERAMAVRDPDDVLTTVERWRAVSHRIDPVAAPPDPELVEATRELRLARHGLADDGPLSAAQLARLEELEQAVSEREWALVVAGSRGAAPAAADATELRAGCPPGTTVVELFESAGQLHALTVSSAGVRLRDLAAVPEAVALAGRLRRDLRARALLGPRSPMRAALERATGSSLAAVDALLSPVWADGERVVVAPSRSLTGVPWRLLPSLAGRAVTATPSVTRWVRGPAGRGPAASRLTVRALRGPGLDHAAEEVEAVAGAWARSPAAVGPGGATIGSDAATSTDVLEALAEAHVVHLAAHGRHEGQSPLFSAVTMADGPVYAHEFPRPVAAEHVVLSACDVGQFSSRPGDEPLGLAIALLSLKATSVLAAVAPVADDVAREAMVAYHRRVAAGADTADALAQVVAEAPEAGVFCLYGSDWRARTPSAVR
ncbi:CHAT domain-containing protein [Phycicoccus endophyticus]|uniref:CHAT domain-containing protein n=1 Tax=Phycicoccus endophyticus TaxID=1690220 RepID=A0A7G9R1H7_9MICO|nr:CHAT domain-containing protein [Phycicoccus endophyticus]NHI18760.1 CHAT domain-containing protein [Phycicoccus endophyticus]QNN49452.1 CHAT domain-containing protein [Phycicoccus endophyticus]GGL36736.1 CHAT domain-containing protein [Phycicoccus endophyticus]